MHLLCRNWGSTNISTTALGMSSAPRSVPHQRFKIIIWLGPRDQYTQCIRDWLAPSYLTATAPIQSRGINNSLHSSPDFIAPDLPEGHHSNVTGSLINKIWLIIALHWGRKLLYLGLLNQVKRSSPRPRGWLGLSGEDRSRSWPLTNYRFAAA